MLSTLSAAMTLDEIRARLGGDERLAEAGAYQFSLDPTHVTFRLGRRNRNHVRTVTVSFQSNGMFGMDCFGALEPGAFRARHIASAHDILPDNLATVFGQLTGMDAFHHHHF
jgi:hypothetical protein